MTAHSTIGRSRPVSIVAVGDIMLGDSAITVGFGVASRYAGGIQHLLVPAMPLLRGADIVFGNLECTLSPAGHQAGVWRSEQMRGLPRYAPELRDGGFTVLNVANNHANQHGREAFEETVKLLERAGIGVCGLKGADGWCARPLRIAPNGTRSVGMLGYCLRPRQYDVHREPPFAEGDRERIQGDVRRLRGSVDEVVVSLHWGEEFVDTPSRMEAELARAVIDAGASMILGHHPHVPRPVETYREGLIAYSLGNFISDMVWQSDLRRGQVLRCQLSDIGAQMAETHSVTIAADYGPHVDGDCPIETNINALDEAAYRQAARRTVFRQRRNAYVYALRRLPAYRPAIFGQLAWATISNKWSAMRARFSEKEVVV